MHPRSVIGLGLLIGGVVLGVSCSGPSSTPSEGVEEDRPSRVYHVRLDVTEKKGAANRILGRALEWWEERSNTFSARPLSSAESPVAVVWQAPLYRIQIGPFASRSEADSVLQEAQSAFPDAFVSPERLDVARQN